MVRSHPTASWHRAATGCLAISTRVGFETCRRLSPGLQPPRRFTTLNRQEPPGIANAANSTAVSYTDLNGIVHNMTKGDLIVLGDYNSMARFDGGSLYSLATGAAVSDATGPGYAGGTLSGGMDGFADSARAGVLRKNTALDYMQNNTADATYSGATPANASAFLRQTAAQWKLQKWQQYYPSATQLDPNGANAFNKFDVNGTGDLSVTEGTGAGEYLDAKIVQKFIGNDYSNLNDQLSANIADDGTPIADPTQTPGSPTAPRAFDLTMAKLTDPTSATDTTITVADFVLIGTDIVIKNTGNPNAVLISGDANFDGRVNALDFNALATGFGSSGEFWDGGDFNSDGVVNTLDFTLLADHFNQTQSINAGNLGTLVPEPQFLLIPVLFGALRRRIGRKRCSK